MELYEGGQYRIDIVGADSSIIVDSNTGRISASLSNSTDTIVVDTEAAKFYGSLVGPVFDSTNNIAYDPNTRQFSGNLRGSMVDSFDDTIIDSQSVNVPLQANIIGANGYVGFDLETRLFKGNFHGDLKDINDNVLLAMDAAEPVLRASLTGNIYSSNGAQVFDTANRLFKNASLQGDIVDPSGTVLLDHDNGTFHGIFSGSIRSMSDGCLLIDQTNGQYRGDLVGNIIGRTTGDILYNNDSERFYGQFVGNISDEAGTTILSNVITNPYLQANVLKSDGSVLLDYNSGTFYGTMDSMVATSLAGDIVNPTTQDTIFDASARTFLAPITADVYGNFDGNIRNTDQDYAYDASSDTWSSHTVIATELFGHLDGSFAGNITHSDGTLFDATTKHWSNVSLTGYLFDNNGLEVFDPQTNTLSTRTLYTDNVIATEIDMDSVQIKADGIQIAIESAYSMPAFTGQFYRAATPNIPDWVQQGIRLEAIGGTWLSPETVDAGHKLPSIGWAAAIAVDPDYEDSTNSEMSDGEQYAIVANIYGKIPDGATFDVNAGEQRGAPGELVFQTQAQDYSVNYMILDSEGKLSTTLNEFKVAGETGVTPSNTSTPDSWLQATVNGETKFIPLYS
jgi:hypothetical protein